MRTPALIFALAGTLLTVGACQSGSSAAEPSGPSGTPSAEVETTGAEARSAEAGRPLATASDEQRVRQTPAAEVEAEGTAAGTGAESMQEASAAAASAPVVAPEPALSARGHGPLSPEARALFWGSPEDPPAENLDATRPDLEGRHYMTSDELNLHLFFPSLWNIGGGYAGVGSDQAYLFIGVMRPNLAWLTDYDPWIKWIHIAYFAFFDSAEDIETFMAYWDRDNEESSMDFLREYYADRPDLEEILFVFDEANRAVHRRLRRLRSRMTQARIPTYVTDEETYAFVRSMIQNGRVRPMLANLLDDEAFVGIGEVARELGVPIRALYLSNAEDYWSYPDQFRANMYALYFDERSVVLRANAAKPENGDYRYNVQSALNFQEWLRQPYVHAIRDIWDRETIEGPDHIPFSFIDEPPVNWRE